MDSKWGLSKPPESPLDLPLNNIRILNVCAVQTENCILIVIVWHQEACCVKPNSYSEWLNFQFALDIIFLHTFPLTFEFQHVTKSCTISCWICSEMSQDVTKPTKWVCAGEDLDQPGHLLSLIRVFAVCMKKAWVLSYPLSTQRRLSSDWAHPHFVGFVSLIVTEVIDSQIFNRIWSQNLTSRQSNSLRLK